MLYAAPFAQLQRDVRPIRERNNRKVYRENWWLHGEARPAMLKALAGLPRFLATPRVSKHRVFVWRTPEVLASDATVAFARDDDYFFGVLHSRFHEVWALKQGTRLETRPRYTPTTCFETFPFPFSPDGSGENASPEPPGEGGPHLRACVETGHAPSRCAPEPETRHAASLPGGAVTEERSAVRDRIAAAAKELNQLRENWLNPPEWTRTEVLEFPGTVGGPWARFIAGNPKAQSPNPKQTGGNPKTEIGVVRYPRLVAKDAACAEKLKERTLTKLYNERPAWLEHAHRKLDEAVAAAYGWPADLSDEEILSRLLALNLERAAAEAKAAPTTRKAQRAKREDELL